MKPLGLYVHWPFCARICPYCDFTVAKNRVVDEEAWIRVLTEDLERFAEFTTVRPLTSIYFGGGTPSLIPLGVAEAVLAKAEAVFGFDPDMERTVEANPDDIERFEGLAGVGFNRLSLGVQSFDDDELRFLGRNHSATQARLATEAAQRQFDRVSFDFIYALPDQTIQVWKQRLDDIVATGAKHLSLYQLTIEPETAFGRAAERGTLVPMPDDRAADFYQVTQEVLEDAGLPAYEVSNHAAPGDEAVHNSLYWADAEWVGIGPGAHGRLEKDGVRVATCGSQAPSKYPDLGFAARQTCEQLSTEDCLLEALASGLRPVAGLELNRLGNFSDRVAKRADPLITEGFMHHEAGRLAATASGRLVLDQLTAFLSEAFDEAAT